MNIAELVSHQKDPKAAAVSFRCYFREADRFILRGCHLLDPPEEDADPLDDAVRAILEDEGAQFRQREDLLFIISSEVEGLVGIGKECDVTKVQDCLQRRTVMDLISEHHDELLRAAVAFGIALGSRMHIGGDR